MIQLYILYACLSAPPLRSTLHRTAEIAREKCKQTAPIKELTEEGEVEHCAEEGCLHMSEQSRALISHQTPVPESLSHPIPSNLEFSHGPGGPGGCGDPCDPVHQSQQSPVSLGSDTINAESAICLLYTQPNCICRNSKLYLSKFKNVFVQN